MAPSFISQLMTNNGPGDNKNALHTSGLPTLGSLGGASTMMTSMSSSVSSSSSSSSSATTSTATSSRGLLKTPVRGPSATPTMLPQLSPVMVGRPGRPDALKFGLPLPLNLSASTASNPMGVPGGGGMLSAGGIRPAFRRQASQQPPAGDGIPASPSLSPTAPPASSLSAAAATAAAGAATAAGRSMAMAPSPWNNSQKIQDFFLHITDMEKAAHAEQKIIDIRELMARNPPPPSSIGAPRGQGPPPAQAATTPEQDKATANSADFKNALSGLLAARQGAGGGGSSGRASPDNQEAEEPEEEDSKSDDSPTGDSEMTREEMRGALANMLSKRGAGAPSPSATRSPPAPETSANARDAMMAMLRKRAGGGAASDEQEAASKPASRADMLSEMLARRGAPADNNSSSNGDGDKANPLAQMLAKRAQSAQSAGEETTPKNPLEQMLLRRGQPPDGAGAGDSAAVALKDDPKYEQYFKMLRFGHPKEVVKHKMQRDGLDPWIMDCDPSKPLPPKPSESTPTSSEGSEDEDIEAEYQAQLKEYEEKHGKYLQMLKVGLPRSVVQHKMQMDGVDPSWLQGPPKRRVSSSSQGPSEQEIAEHKKKFDKYFKMLRMGLPRGAVEHKMRMAGVDPKELDGPRRPATSAGASTAATPVKPKLARQESIRKKLHWEAKRRRDSDIPRDSLWGLSSEKTLREVKISTESREMLEKLFVKDMSEANKKRDAAGAGVGGKGASPAAKKKPMIALIDMKKSQNIAITLARVKMGFPELKRELLCLNPAVLSTAQLQSLIDMWPDSNEQQAINKFSGDVSSLGSGEKFLWEVRSIPRCKELLGCLIFKQEFPSRVQELKESIHLVMKGVDQVCSSAGLRQLFIYILQIGNLLNFGTDATHSAVEGFSLGSLVKFSQTKAFVGGITFLQYVVQSIERDVPHLARFYDEIDLIAKCSKVSFHSLTAEKHALEAGCASILAEAERAGTTRSVATPELDMSSSILKKFADECEHELSVLQELLDKAEESKAHFLKYFEEEGTEEELDVLLSHIANFTAEYHREHLKYLDKMKREMKGLFKKFSPASNPSEGDAKKQTAGSKDTDGSALKGSSSSRREESDVMRPVLRRRASRQGEDEERVAHPQPHRVIHEPKSLPLDELSGQSDSEPDFDDVSTDGMSADGGSVPPSPSAAAAATRSA